MKLLRVHASGAQLVNPARRRAKSSPRHPNGEELAGLVWSFAQLLKIGAAVCASRKRPSGIPDHRVDQHLDGIPDVLDDHGLLAFLLRDDATFLTFGSNHLHLVGIPYLMDVAYHDANPVIKLVRRMCILAPATIPQREVLSSLSRHGRGVISPT